MDNEFDRNSYQTRFQFYPALLFKTGNVDITLNSSLPKTAKKKKK